MAEPALQIAALALLLPIASAVQSGSLSGPSNPPDASPTVPFVHVETGVQLEVPGWGGSGRHLIFMGGLRFDAHVYDAFPPKFASSYHAYAMTRRGFGASGIQAPVFRSNEKDVTGATNAFLTCLP